MATVATPVSWNVGLAELRSRLAKTRDQITLLDAQREQHNKNLDREEQEVRELKRLAALQDRTLQVFREQDRQRQLLAAQVKQSKIAITEPVSAQVIMPEAPTQIQAATADTLPRQLVDGALAVLIALLLGWAMFLRSRNAAQNAELAEITAAKAVDYSSAGPQSTELAVGSPRTSQAEPDQEHATVKLSTPLVTLVTDGDESVQAEPDQEGGDTLPDDEPTSLSAVDSITGGDVQKGTGAEELSAQPVDGEDGVYEFAARDAAIDEADVASSTARNAAASALPVAGSDTPVPANDNMEAEDWSPTTLRRKAADPKALREVDTLIAFENYEPAELLLDELMRTNPGNPEYHLRLLHIQSATGDPDKVEEEEHILAAMMNGPLSETIGRVKEIGRGLMPGHHLFDGDEQVAEAKRIIAERALNRERASPDEASSSPAGVPGEIVSLDDADPVSPAENSGEVDINFNSAEFDFPPAPDEDKEPR